MAIISNEIITKEMHSGNADADADCRKNYYRYGGDVLFPFKLHDMLEAAEENGFSSVVSWLPDGHSFKVHDKETFASLIMLRYFEQTKYKSFQRQLNMWGFERNLADGPAKGAYGHEFFDRENQSLCCRMKRLKKRRQQDVHKGSKNTKAKRVARQHKKKMVRPRTMCKNVATPPLTTPSIVPGSQDGKIPTTIEFSSPMKAISLCDNAPVTAPVTRSSSSCSVVSHEDEETTGMSEEQQRLHFSVEESDIDQVRRRQSIQVKPLSVAVARSCCNKSIKNQQHVILTQSTAQNACTETKSTPRVSLGDQSMHEDTDSIMDVFAGRKFFLVPDYVEHRMITH